MIIHKIPFSETGQFTKAFTDYTEGNPALREFYNLPPVPESFLKQISLKNFSDEKRQGLVYELNNQYKALDVSEQTRENIDALTDSKTFTLTTGHQLNIFTGPLYFIYKIATTILACRDLQKKYPQHKFVPVYWMGSEDHDFEEISYFYLNNKKYEWETDQSGAVGRFNPKSLKTILDKLPGHHPIFEKAYLKHDTLADSVRYYVNELFKDFGLVIIDSDKRVLKQEFRKVMEEDILHQQVLPSVDKSTEKLTQAGYHQQIHARDINFFYLDDGIRSRIEKIGDQYHVVDTDLVFSESEIKTMIEEEPEKLSPNVILRPLYQEIILPNLAYIGGPSELTYWFQLKDVFKQFKTPFPVLLPRNFGGILPHHIYRKWDKTGFEVKDLFTPVGELIKTYTLNNTANELEVNGQREAIKAEFNSIKEQAAQIDTTLVAHIEAQTKRFLNAIEGIEKKMIRAEKRKYGEVSAQLQVVKDYLFPGGGLQERRDNFLNFYMEDPTFIHHLAEYFDPFDLRFHVMIDQNQ